ncbi:hypothetical protein NVP2275O_441 [Vibrio phage 2.275.O._10N.286.54.E11]|nr:hypothetical protein NVP2275O_441 [Vibrio phage 2.275.O._10N.286.54.E11]
MKLVELFEANTDTLYDAEDDKRVYSLDDTRKPTLTLRELNKLRKYRDFKKRQDAERDSIAAVVYASPDEGTNMPSGGGGF